MDWTFDLTFHSHKPLNIVKFQKISILPQKKGLEIPEEGGGVSQTKQFILENINV